MKSLSIYPEVCVSISFIATMPKIFKRLLSKRLYRLIEINGPWPMQRYGFRKIVRVCDTLFYINHNCQLDFNTGCWSTLISIDFSLMFD